MIESPLLLAALIVGATGLAFWLDYRVAPLSKVGASLLTILLGAAMSNTGLVTPSSPVYGVVSGPVTSLAVVWLLLAVNLRDLKKAGARMLGAFGIAVVGTALGAVVGAALFAGALGDATWRLAGTLTGTYSGGGLNFVAVGRGLELPEHLFAGATAADATTTAIWLGACLVLPLWLGRFYPTPVPTPADDDEEVEHPFFAESSLSTLQISLLLAVGFLLVVGSEWVGTVVPAIPSILWLTTFALIVGHLGPFRDPPGAMQLGNLALHFFFVVIGIHSRVAEIIAVGPEVFLYTLVVVGVGGALSFVLGRLFKMDVGTVAVASQAAVGGPSSALAVAVSREWSALVLPGIIVGLLGYALGNYLGFAVGYLVRGMGLGL